ncbi:hypothetical protein GCM10010387_13300 [Streptomyces inusitatus]|uniref:Uncharacterized protein n=1 Tax=Streptomyces inusitatus TaxID=68221 RepID=A0A918UM16_9ACTN|nr:hypothetical protein [Streptomyces inusitatus]GGZ21563.1 hypothetical protein GCM10010387_13300 [Streptomyces inusitatus]
MALRMLGKDPNSPDGNSPTVYVDDEADRYLVQGFKVLDEERLGQMNIPEHETVVEIPRYMVQFFLPSDRKTAAEDAEPEVQKGVEYPDV